MDLPFRPDSFAAFVVLADLTIGDDQFQVETDRVLEAERSLLDLCERELPAYQVPVFVHAVQVTFSVENYYTYPIHSPCALLVSTMTWLFRIPCLAWTVAAVVAVVADRWTARRWWCWHRRSFPIKPWCCPALPWKHR